MACLASSSMTLLGR
jgi:hypothetical protein